MDNLRHPVLRDIERLSKPSDEEGCVTDFLSNFSISNSNKGTIPFVPHIQQTRMLNWMHSHQNCAFIHRRQIGTSSIILGRLIYEMLLNPNQHIALLAGSNAQAQHNMNILNGILLSNKSLVGGIVRDTRTELVLNNGSVIRSCSSVKSLRGKLLTHVFHDNFLHDTRRWQKFDYYSGLLSRTNGRITIASTSYIGLNEIDDCKKLRQLRL